MRKLKDFLISFIKMNIENYINKKNNILNKKIQKHHEFSDWFYCVVCNKKFKMCH